MFPRLRIEQFQSLSETLARRTPVGDGTEPNYFAGLLHGPGGGVGDLQGAVQHAAGGDVGVAVQHLAVQLCAAVDPAEDVAQVGGVELVDVHGRVNRAANRHVLGPAARVADRHSDAGRQLPRVVNRVLLHLAWPRCRLDEVDHAIFDDVIWPTLAHRVPGFEALRVENCWSGYYEYNVLDQNAIIGYHPAIDNCVFANGFSGHGLQQGPATGRGVSELILNGRYTTLDLSSLDWSRVLEDRPIVEKNVV